MPTSSYPDKKNWDTELLEEGTAEWVIGVLWKTFGVTASDPAIRWFLFERPLNDSVASFLVHMQLEVGHEITVVCANMLADAEVMPQIKPETLERLWESN